MRIRVAHTIPLVGHPVATAQGVEASLDDATTAVIVTQLGGAPLEIEITEGDDVEGGELVIRLRGMGKLSLVPSSANSVRLRRVRH